MSWQRPNIGSRINREVHVRFWERAEVKFLRATRQNPNLPHRNSNGRFTSQSGLTETVWVQERGPLLSHSPF